jgi:hypothetical protein
VLLREMQIQHPTAMMIARTATAQDDICGCVHWQRDIGAAYQQLVAYHSTPGPGLAHTQQTLTAAGVVQGRHVVHGAADRGAAEAVRAVPGGGDAPARAGGGV